MPKLRGDLLRNLPPDDQELMKRFRKRPLKAYTVKELLPPNSNAISNIAFEISLTFRLDSLISQNLIMKIVSDDGQVYYAKAKGRALLPVHSAGAPHL